VIDMRRLAARLEPLVPHWVLGSEEPGNQRTQLKQAGILAGCDPAFLPVLRGMAQWAWQERPFSRRLLHGLLKLDGGAAFLAPECRAFLDRLRPLAFAPVRAAGLREVGEAGEHARLAGFLLKLLRDPAHGPFWLGQAWDFLVRLGRADLPRDMLAALGPRPEIAPLLDRLLAEWAFLYLPPQEALEYVLLLDEAVFGLWKRQALCELWLRLGERGKAVTALRALWRQLPWHVNASLKLHDLLSAPLRRGPVGPKDAAILLYSWNKADLLSRTLERLATSGIGEARVVVLDNGSGDATAEVLARAEGLFAPGRFLGVRLPVNVGAPAARNWLLSLPEVRACRFAAFLDDDVLVPEGWLPRLIAAAGSRPGVGAVGCRIVSASPPAAVQSADYNLLLPREGAKLFEDFEENILFFDNCKDSLDFGQFSYARPALSVSGCCHLLAMSAVEQVGGFDIRFAPTQFDDLERDMRLNLAGFAVLYAGDLAVGHVQHSSLAKARTLSGVAQVFGNKIKLEGKYGKAEVRGLAERTLAALWTDLAAKWAMLDEATS
jgi:GT2 family glycosyltransferase